MQGGIEGVGAVLTAPVIYLLYPFIVSHSILPSIEYTYFLKEVAPSVYFCGTFGMGIIYDREISRTGGGHGFSIGAGYEFRNRSRLKFGLMNTKLKSGLSANTLMFGISFYLY